MRRRPIRRIRIQWEGPHSINEVLALKNEKKDYGLYQIYGHHVVFGGGSLLYIGMAQKQTFGERIKQHYCDWLHEENDPAIRVGRIAEEEYKEQDDWRDWENLLEDAESLTIYWNSPPYNTKRINKYNGKALHVQNWGNRGSILPEYTSEWKPPRPKE